MLKEIKSIEKSAGLNRAAWHKPLISIVITHYNYADHIEDAILSLLDQTYENWECVVVDDASSYEQHAQLVVILDRIGSPKIRLVEHSENLGQIPAFFTGLDATSGNFVCLLDPDDRYAKTFLEETLACHLMPSIIVPIVCTDQYLLGEHGVIAGGAAWHSQCKIGAGTVEETIGTSFIPPDIDGWHWTSTSSMMFRRSSLRFLKPSRQLAYKRSVDAYLATGAHSLGGTAFLHRSLVYRQIHEHNSYISKSIVSSRCNHMRPDADVPIYKVCAIDAYEALIHNGAPTLRLTQARKKKRGLLAKWRRSFNKRWQKLFGKSAR